MIIGGEKQAVVNHIRRAVAKQDFNVKVEVDDPEITPDQQHAIIDGFLNRDRGWWSKFNHGVARGVANLMTRMLNRDTTIVGLEHLVAIKTGAIVTSNHFNPLDNTAIRYATRKAHRKHLYIVSEDTNLAMPGFVGYLMRHYDTMPITTNKNYMGRIFPKLIEQTLQRHELILIYPEAEMWFNYRKPRPPKRGSYYYAARFNVPVISCFIEQRDQFTKDNAEFSHVAYTVHILPPIYPDPALSVRENSLWMMKQDYQQKVDAFESAYDEKLTYRFEPGDIVGWRGH